MSNLTDFSAATVPATDSASNVLSRDAVGSKADTAVGTGTAANSTLSILAYLKALWNLLRAIAHTNGVTAYATLTTGTSIDLRPTAGINRRVTVAVLAGNDTGFVEIHLYDGTHSLMMARANSLGSAGFTLIANTSTMGLRVVNNQGVSANYMAVYSDELM